MKFLFYGGVELISQIFCLCVPTVSAPFEVCIGLHFLRLFSLCSSTFSFVFVFFTRRWSRLY